MELRHRGGVSTWRGEIAGHADSHVLLAARDGALSGTVRVGDRLFTIQPRRDGLLLVEWDESAAPTDAPAVVPNVRRHSPIRASRARARADGVARLDVLVLYTAEAAAVAGGPAAIETTIALAVEEANRSWGSPPTGGT